jgi:hypothetical protein
MRFWRAIGDGSLLLVYAAPAVGPLTRLWPRAGRLVVIRWELGMWFGVFHLVVLHTANFLFIHYPQHFHRLAPPIPPLFRYPL